MNPTSTGSVAYERVRTTTITTVRKTVVDPFGQPISTEARAEALELLVEEFGCPPLASDTAVSEAADLLERDHPDAAIRSLMTVCDLTGAYRAIAVMCTHRDSSGVQS